MYDLRSRSARQQVLLPPGWGVCTQIPAHPDPLQVCFPPPLPTPSAPPLPNRSASLPPLPTAPNPPQALVRC